jgi:hypothetical protein
MLVLFFNVNFYSVISFNNKHKKCICIFGYKFSNMKQIMSSLALCVILFAACKKNKNEEVVPTSTGFQWPAGTGEYAPHTNGSTFTFEIVSGTPAVTDSFTYTVTKDTAIGGVTYRKLESNKPALAPTYYANYTAGVVTNIALNFTVQSFNVGTVKQTILKDNVPLNSMWSDTINVAAPLIGNVPVSFTSTIMQKDFVKNILSKDYSGTIYAKQIIGIPAAVATFLNIPATSQIDNYFAKGVGLVQKDATGNNVKIKRYNIVK